MVETRLWQGGREGEDPPLSLPALHTPLFTLFFYSKCFPLVKSRERGTENSKAWGLQLVDVRL